MDRVNTAQLRFSAVKEAVEAQSGRFEFLKQALTLGLAGIAGLAALLTDSDKVPTELSTRIVIAAGGITLFVATGAALAGLLVYAQLLREVEKEEGMLAVANAANTPPADLTKIRDRVQKLREGVADRANLCTFGLGSSGLLLLIFGALRLASANVESPVTVLNQSCSIVERQLLSTGQSFSMDSFKIDSSGYIVRYVIEPTHAVYSIRIRRLSRDLDIERSAP